MLFAKSDSLYFALHATEKEIVLYMLIGYTGDIVRTHKRR